MMALQDITYIHAAYKCQMEARRTSKRGILSTCAMVHGSSTVFYGELAEVVGFATVD